MSSWIISGGGHYYSCMAGRTRSVNTLVHHIDQRQTSTGGVAGCPGGAEANAGLQQWGREGSCPLSHGHGCSARILPAPATNAGTHREGHCGSGRAVGQHGGHGAPRGCGAAWEPQSPLLALPIFSCGIAQGLHGSCAYLSYKGKLCHCHAA